MSWGSIGGAAIGAVSSYMSSKNSAKAAGKAGQLDPRIDRTIFGGEGDRGLLSQYRDLFEQPRSNGAQSFANANEAYLGAYGANDLGASRDAAYKAMQGTTAPTMQAAQTGAASSNGAQSAGALISGPAWAVGSDVKAPSQNNIDLSGSYNSLINGAPGSNPYLTGSIQKGINQSTNAFGNMVTDAKAATQDVLGSIRGNSVLAGQFGGSRQGIAEGKAIDSMNTNLARAASQFGQNNTDAAVSAQAGAYNTDRDRQLAATQGLGAQQYGVAQQNAATKNQAEFTNVANHNNILQNNASMTQQNNQFNAGLAQQTGQFNAGLGQQAGLANQQAQLATNAQNNSSNLAGAGLLSGLTGQASAQVNANDNWKLDRTQAVNSLLQPYLAGSPTQNPVSANGAGSALGGGLMGLQLGSQLGGLFGGSSGATSLQTTGSAGNYGFAPSNLPVQSFPYSW